jgi:hypothetical protein
MSFRRYGNEEQQQEKCGIIVSRFQKAACDRYDKINAVTASNINEYIVTE